MMDWPLSQKEKTTHLVRVCQSEVLAAEEAEKNALRQSEASQVEALREDAAGKLLEAAQRAAGNDGESDEVNQQRVLLAYESAMAVFRAMTLNKDSEEPESFNAAEMTPPKVRTGSCGGRARSEGSVKPAMRRKPGLVKRRVSFGDQPEAEPSDVSTVGQDVDSADAAAAVCRAPSFDSARRSGQGEDMWNHHRRVSNQDYNAYSWGHGGGIAAPAPDYSAPWQSFPPATPGPGYGWPPTSARGSAPPAHGWAAHQAASYNNFSPWEAPGHSIGIYVEAAPEVQPNLQRGLNGTFVMHVPGIKVKLTTHCTPQPRHYPHLAGFKPYEEFSVALPEVQQVIFDPQANMPPNGRFWCRAHKRGAVIELPSHMVMDAKLKTDSPFGSLILEDISADGEHKVGETVLNYRLQVEGQLTVGQGSGNMGSNRLQLDLDFIFDCYIGGAPVGQPNRIQCSSHAAGYGVSGYGGHSRAEGCGYAQQPPAYAKGASSVAKPLQDAEEEKWGYMCKSHSEGCL